jgi:3-hydroxyisobutyrate dehydrogenase/2-hydroxy-3-oxopropionate reductase
MIPVGLLGTGRMGSAMARALGRAGFEVICWNRTADTARALASELGGRAVGTPAEVARVADVCVSMLADGRAVEAVYLGKDGLIAGAGPQNVLVDCSTVAPTTLRGLRPAAAGTGAALLDAPVSGSVTLAVDGNLTIMVGGEERDVERARPVLDALAKTVFHMGPLGTGSAMKLAVNTVIFGLNQALAEGLVLAEAAGVDRERAYEVLTASAVGAPYVAYKRAHFVDPETTPVAFSLELTAKDLRLISAFADELGVELPQTALNLDVVEAAAADGGAGRDFASVAVHLRGTARTKEDTTA